MRYIRFVLLGLLIVGGAALVIAHSISTEEIIGSVKGEKVAVTTMNWNGQEVFWHNRDGRSYARFVEAPGVVRLSCSGRVKVRQTVFFNGKKFHAKYNESFNQGDGYDIRLDQENKGSSFVLYATPHWNVTKRKILFWELMGLKKKHLSFSYAAQKNDD